MKKNEGKKNTKSNVFWLGIVSLLADASSEMIAPVMPLFLSSVLGASGFMIGLIEGIAKSAERLLSFVFGWYSDKIGKRKPVIAFGYFLSSIMKGAFAFTTVWTEFLFARVIERTGKAIRDAPRDALLASSTGDSLEERRKGFALHRMLDTIGAIIGPLIALLFVASLTLDFESTVRNLFILSLIPGLLGVLIVLIFVKDVELKKSERTKKSILKSFSIEYGDSYKQFLFSLVPFFLFAPPLAFIYLQASEFGLVLSGVITLGFLYSVFYILGANLINFASDKFKMKIGRKQGIEISLLFVMLSFLVVFLVQYLLDQGNAITFIFLILALVLYGMGMGMFEVESKSYISLLVEKKEMGGAFGAYQTISGVMIIFSGLIFGFIWDFSPGFAFLLAGISTFVSLFLFRFFTYTTVK
ncbi:MAG: MFS transporter [Candidatus Micrarchaeia archaeon]